MSEEQPRFIYESNEGQWIIDQLPEIAQNHSMTFAELERFVYNGSTNKLAL